jgi:hypothetical protein
MQFPRMSTRLLMLIGALLALVLGGIRLIDDIYYMDLIYSTNQLAKVRGATDIHVYGFDDLTYEVTFATFTIAGRPDAMIEIQGPQGGVVGDPGHLWLRRLGPWEFHEYTYGHMGVTDLSGKPIETLGFRDWIDIGPKGGYGAMLPVRIRDANDVVAHYDELVRFFASWPDQKRWGMMISPSGMRTAYCVSPVGTWPISPPPNFPSP